MGLVVVLTSLYEVATGRLHRWQSGFGSDPVSRRSAPGRFWSTLALETLAGLALLLGGLYHLLPSDPPSLRLGACGGVLALSLVTLAVTGVLRAPGED